MAIVSFLYAPLLTFLRAPPTKEEKKVCDTAGIDNKGMDMPEINSSPPVKTECNA